jgi:hypothetical protein
VKYQLINNFRIFCRRKWKNVQKEEKSLNFFSEKAVKKVIFDFVCWKKLEKGEEGAN